MIHKYISTKTNIAILAIFILLRIPSLFEPYWYGDEGVYQVIGAGLREGRTMYLEAWDNKPPLLFLLYAAINGDQFLARAISMVFGAVSIVVFARLASLLLSSRIAATGALWVYALLLGLPMLEGNIANTENVMILPIVTAVYLFVLSRMQQTRLLFFSGIFLSVAFLHKVVAVFDIATMLVVLVLSGRIKGLIPLGTGIFIPIGITMLILQWQQLLQPFFGALVLDNTNYTAWKNSFLIPNGLLYLKTFALAGALWFLYLKRKTYPFEKLLIYSWLFLSIYNVLFSGRDYAHYLILLIPAFCLFLGYTIQLPYRLASLLPILFLCIGINRYFSLYLNISGYYTNAISYMLNKKSSESYQSFFDPSVVRDYAIASYINTNAAKTDTVFIWGNNPQLYALMRKLPPGRFSTAYHIVHSQDRIEETKLALEKTMPTYIIFLPVYEKLPFDLGRYEPKAYIHNAIIYRIKS
jgi:hypothetical protein